MADLKNPMSALKAQKWDIIVRHAQIRLTRERPSKGLHLFPAFLSDPQGGGEGGLGE